MRVGVVGAGIAGLACADALAEAGHATTLFDKGRGPGGRMSTRRAEGYAFDHGAQYMTARDPGFVRQVEAWERAGVAARWPAAGPDAWVGTPGMSAPVRAMAERHDVRWNVRVEPLRREPDGWTLDGVDAPEPFDAVVVAVPAEQAAPLLAPHHPAFASLAASSRTLPCWTVMAAFDTPLPAPDVVRDAGPIGWAARDGAKPGRSGAETWVVQAAPGWSAEHLELPPEEVAPLLLDLFAHAVGVALPRPAHRSAHRWRYARAQAPADAPGALWDADARLGACGDWLLGPRVEAAWLSGRRLAAMVAAARVAP